MAHVPDDPHPDIEPDTEPNTEPDTGDALEGEVVAATADLGAGLGADLGAGLGALAIIPVPSEDSRALATVPRLERFLSQIKRYALLSDVEERDLARRAREHEDPGAARKLVLHNLRLVVSIAYEFRRAWANVMDLVQEGSIGLVEAVRRWDPERGARLSTYAGYWIRAYVLRYVLNNFRMVHVGNTRAGRKLFFQLERERQKLLTAGIEPSTERIAHNLDVDERDVREVAGHLAAPELPLDSPHGDDGRPLSDTLGGRGADPETAAAGSETSMVLQTLTRAFGAGLTDPREEAIWREHLVSDEPASLSDLGARFGVSKQYMGQIVTRLKKRFREELVRQYGAGVQLSWLLSDPDA